MKKCSVNFSKKAVIIVGRNEFFFYETYIFLFFCSFFWFINRFFLLRMLHKDESLPISSSSEKNAKPSRLIKLPEPEKGLLLSATIVP